MSARYVGRLESVRLWDGSRVKVSGVVGLVDGVGLVTARTKPELMAGQFATPGRGRYQAAAAVYYYRDRDGYPSRYWVHELDSTSVQVGAAGGVPVFAHSVGGAAHVCAMPGDFICAG